MKRLIQGVDYSIRKETVNEVVAAGRFNAALVIRFSDKSGTQEHVLSSGYRDVLEVFRNRQTTYVVMVNYNLEYAGLEVFEGGEKIDDLFFSERDNYTQLTRGRALLPATILKKMLIILRDRG